MFRRLLFRRLGGYSQKDDLPGKSGELIPVGAQSKAPLVITHSFVRLVTMRSASHDG